MILANGINGPIVVAAGLITFGPLTLLVSTVESLAIGRRLKIGLRPVFTRVLVANVLSTFAGGVVLMFQDGVVEATGIRESIPAFVRGYRWVALLLIALYFAKSVLVEGLWLTRRRVLERFARPRRSVVHAVLLANVLSYVIVGPLFYIATRPHFAGLETTFDADWTANPGLVVYYIDRHDEFIKRTRLGSGEVETLVPQRAAAFVVSEDESTCVYWGSSGGLWAYQPTRSETPPVRILDRGVPRHAVSIAPDNRRVAFLDRTGDASPYNVEPTLKVIELTSREVVNVGKLPAGDWGSPVAWSAGGDVIYVVYMVRDESGADRTGRLAVSVYDADPPYALRETRSDLPALTELVANYGDFRGDQWPSYLPSTIRRYGPQKAGAYEYITWPYYGSAMRVTRDGRLVLALRNSYGLLNFSLPPILGAAPLPAGDELLVAWWGQGYLLSLAERRLGPAVDGEYFVLRTPEFRIPFESDDND
jgi:hypothetical protein